MADLAKAEDLLFRRTGLDQRKVQAIVDDSLHGADDGELFLEHRQSETFAWDDGKLKAATYDTSQGFGLRAVVGEATGFAHASELSEEAMKRAAAAVKSVRTGQGGTYADAPRGTNRAMYGEVSLLEEVPFGDKVKLLQEVDAYARGKDPRVRQVSCSLAANWQVVEIVRAGGTRVADIRPLMRFAVSVEVEHNGRQETGFSGGGGRYGYQHYCAPSNWKAEVDEALRIALVNLESVPAPAGEMPVVLGSGWCGVLLHEAVGHGLEGDFNRKKTSAFSGLMGQRVAAEGVTVVDDGTLLEHRGSLTVDDEGTPTQRNVLIEDGILTGYMQDRMNARLMGLQPTGNGRRESFASMPMPRMTNTFMLGGERDPQAILRSVKDGVYAVGFGGGSVDITSGKFVFSCTEAYKIEDGKVTTPIKGATLIGNGPDILTKVAAIGNDMKLDKGIGMCGKNGQNVPTIVGQPSMLISAMTVGGTTTARAAAKGISSAAGSMGR
ncbi:MAG: metalloprotease TldD [Alphaproteobacteria bacterium]|nr:metalloprotease TldD [Alphaproteobacteria bacterium]